ncbi:MAG: hypothetical protein SGPRY_012854 [Prymnesium sp.]
MEICSFTMAKAVWSPPVSLLAPSQEHALPDEQESAAHDTPSTSLALSAMQAFDTLLRAQEVVEAQSDQGTRASKASTRPSTAARTAIVKADVPHINSSGVKQNIPSYLHQSHLRAPVPLSQSPQTQITMMDLHVKSILQEYALKRAQLLTSSLISSAAPATALAASHSIANGLRPVIPNQVPNPLQSSRVSPSDQPPSSTRLCISPAVSDAESTSKANIRMAEDSADNESKVLPKRKLESWSSKSWAVKDSGRRQPGMRWAAQNVRWQAKRAKTDASRAPPRPFGVHMVCMSANEAKEGGCGCRQEAEPKMEHNGVNGIGEWHVVTQPHFNCPRGSYRPAIFVTECEAASCECRCHVPGSGVDSADCKCKGHWRRLKPEEWVKTTTAPTANSWKDRRAERERAKTAAKAMAVVAATGPVDQLAFH